MKEALRLAMAQLSNEMVSARQWFSPFHSHHEAIAVLREEYLELETSIFTEQSSNQVRGAALQVAAMAMLLIVELESGLEREQAT